VSSIKGKERKQLRAALGEAFKAYEGLRRMAIDQLDFDLNSRTDAKAGMDAATDALIEAMDEFEGRAGIVRLIEAARAERPAQPELREVERLFMQTGDPLGDVYPTQAVADKVVHRAAMTEFKQLVNEHERSNNAFPSPDVADHVIDRAGLQRVIVKTAGLPEFKEVTARLGSAEYRVCLVAY
jgi:Effector-associated domain 1